MFIRFAVLLALAAGVAVTGCGGDDDNPAGPGDGNTVVDVRDGTWEIVTTTTYTGDDPTCIQPQEEETETEVFCRADFEEELGEEGIPLECDVQLDGTEFTINCSAVLPAGNCTLITAVTGGGTITETRFDMTITATLSATGSAPECGQIPACVITMNSVGTWMNSEGAEICGESAGSIPARSLLSRTISRMVD
jgi:hypothetical protein